MQTLLLVLFEAFGWVLGERASPAVRRASPAARIGLAAAVVMTAFVLAVAVVLAAGFLGGLWKSA